MKYLIIWDWDNTLADTFEALYDAHIDICDKYKKTHVTKEEVLSAICGEGASFWDRLFADIDLEERRIYYYKQSEVRLKEKAKMFAEAYEVLDWVDKKGMDQIVLSNQMQWLLDIECQRLGVEKYFKRIIGRTDELKKPHVDYLNRALSGLEYEACLIMGDGASDMKMAQKLGGFGLLVRSHDPKEGMVYDKHVRNLSEALMYLKKRFGEK